MTRTQTDTTRTAPGRPMELVLTIVHHPDPASMGVGRPLPEGRSFTLGRGDVECLPGHLDAPLVSRAHATLERVGERLRVADAGSRNGTWVNGARVAEALLTEGDVLGLGSVLLLVHRTPAIFGEPDHPRLLGRSHRIAGVIEQSRLVARRDTPVLILGETGTGKELVAQEVHARSGRSGELVAVNCAAMADGVLQSELFGHTRGAFSGAHSARRGLVASAAGGTLFLDEVADAGPQLQASLLRLVENHEYRQVGSDAILTSDARFVAASSLRLRERVASGAFRDDLWTRLSRWVIEVPPLRERREDVPLLAGHFVRQFTGRATPLSRELALELLRHEWPGNVRELQGVVERAVLASGGAETIDLPPWLTEQLARDRQAFGGDPPAQAPPAPEGLVSRLRRPKRERPQREELLAAAAERDGNVSLLARDYDVSRKTIYRWFAALGVDPGDVRRPE